MEQMNISESSVRCLNSSAWSVDSLEFEEELVIQRLEIAKRDLQHGIKMEVSGNAILQANLERKKQVLHKRRLELETLQEHLCVWAEQYMGARPIDKNSGKNRSVTEIAKNPISNKSTTMKVSYSQLQRRIRLLMKGASTVWSARGKAWKKDERQKKHLSLQGDFVR